MSSACCKKRCCAHVHAGWWPANTASAPASKRCISVYVQMTDYRRTAVLDNPARSDLSRPVDGVAPGSTVCYVGARARVVRRRIGAQDDSLQATNELARARDASPHEGAAAAAGAGRSARDESGVVAGMKAVSEITHARTQLAHPRSSLCCRSSGAGNQGERKEARRTPALVSREPVYTISRWPVRSAGSSCASSQRMYTFCGSSLLGFDTHHLK